MTEQKIEAFWRNATAEDIARVMAGETVEARFRDIALRDWKFGHLNGWADGEFRCDLAMSWKQCQVYDPPQWWLDKPDPGEGWRILHPDERVEKGDEYYSSANNMWLLSGSPDTCDCKQANFPYRRRIEPVETVESKPLLIRRRVIEIGDEIKLPNGRVLVFNGEGFEVP
jgi:hypothetical protein